MPKKKVVSEYTVTDDNTILELQKCLDKISKPSRHSRIECFELTVCDVEITPTILALLVQVLNQPLPKARCAMDLKWDRVSFDYCGFIEQDLSQLTMEDQVSCSQEEIQIFASSLARRTLSLRLSESPDILECLLDTPQLEMNALSLRCSIFTGVDSARLGGVVQRCVSLKNLGCEFASYVLTLQGLQLLAEGLADALHLQSISFLMYLKGNELADALFRDGGNGIVRQIVSPQSYLQKLELVGIRLEDRHFLKIVQVLPTSQLQVFNVRENEIGCEGVLSFAHQLHKIKSLNDVDLSCNPWIRAHDLYEECMSALLHGMIGNHSIEKLRVSEAENRLQYFSQANRARRLILETANPIPVGLYPWMLERIGTHERRAVRFQAGRANSLYFVLRNGPILSSASLWRSRRKRKRVDRYS